MGPGGRVSPLISAAAQKRGARSGTNVPMITELGIIIIQK